MKTSALRIAVSAVFAIFLLFAAYPTYGMGAKGNDVPQQEKSDSGQPGSEHPGSRQQDDLSSETSGSVNKKSAVPKKKPRLKYRDEPGCTC